MSRSRYPNLAIALVCVLVLPFVVQWVGLTVTSASDILILAIAALALNLLVGYMGLISFGHGFWFGLGAYAVALAQHHLFPQQMFLPALIALVGSAIVAVVIGFLILRRRGVYFSLLTLALTALGYAVAFRWTNITGGENGIGGIVRTQFLGFDLRTDLDYYVVVAVIAMLVVFGLQRLVRSPLGTVLVAIRENEERAGFLGYSTDRKSVV